MSIFDYACKQVLHVLELFVSKMSTRPWFDNEQDRKRLDENISRGVVHSGITQCGDASSDQLVGQVIRIVYAGYKV